MKNVFKLRKERPIMMHGKKRVTNKSLKLKDTTQSKKHHWFIVENGEARLIGE